MKLISELTDKEVFGKSVPINEKISLLRRTVRVIGFRTDGQIAIIKIDSRGHHVLPGGAIEREESLKSALEREVMEEVGAKINNVKEIGLIIEYRMQEVPNENSP